MKTIGILGGVGPQTTAKVYLSIIDLIRTSGQKKYPPITIYNLPFPFVIEHEAIIQGINVEKMIPYLIDGAKILEKAGVDFAILPCNTLHTYIEEVRQSVNFPVLSILEETSLTLKEKSISTVGLLATQTTIANNIYENTLKKNNISILYPTTEEQAALNQLIVELLNGKEHKVHKETLQQICNALYQRGAKVILLACTDLQLIASDIKTAASLIDTTEILINAAVREMLAGSS